MHSKVIFCAPYSL